MIWILHFCISLLILSAAAGYIYYCEKNKIKRIKQLKGINIYVLAVAAAAFVLYIPYYHSAVVTDAKYIQSIMVSIYSVIRTFTFDGDYSMFIADINTGSRGFDAVYLAYSLVLMVVAPFLTATVALSFIKDATAGWNYWRRRKSETFIFSQLNDRSLILAKDLHKKHEDAVVVFAKTGDDKEEVENNLLEQAEEIDAICFKKDILSLKLRLNKLTKRTVFFVMGESDGENIDITLNLIETHKDRDNTELYIFSDSVESSLLLAAANKGKVKVRRIDEIKSLIYRNLHNEGTMLFDGARVEKDHKRISALIVGLGKYGTFMLKTLVWYCQMDGYRIDITAVDKDEKAESKFTAQCTSLMARENRGVYVEGEAQYNITIYSGVDVDSKEFGDVIRKLPKTTYAFTALGTDEDNIRTAVNLRMLFSRMHTNPVIQAVLHSSAQKEALQDAQNFDKQAYDISYIGDLESSYTEDVIINKKLTDAALKCHHAWAGNIKDKVKRAAKEKEFWDFEYNYYSSMAAAIHNVARIHCGIEGAGKEEEQLSAEEAEIINDLEHRRWNAYMRTEGYAYSGSKDKKTKNHLAKVHHDLVPTALLNQEERAKDIRVGTA